MSSMESQAVGTAGPPTSGNVGVMRQENAFLRQRLFSLDTYRGLIMVTLMFSGFGLAQSATRMQDSTLEGASDPVWSDLEHHFSHVEWIGWGYWDLIQPSFMFMVGVAMAYSYLQRERRGQGFLRQYMHVIWRSCLLILLGIFFSSRGSAHTATNWSFMNVLTQIGLGYPFLFLFRGRHCIINIVGIVAVLGATWAAYFFWEDAGIELGPNVPLVGVTEEFVASELEDLDPVWHKNANYGHWLDTHFLNWFPGPEQKSESGQQNGAEQKSGSQDGDGEHEGWFKFNKGGYQTVNFIPSIATMLLGLLCGDLLRSTTRGVNFKLLMMLLLGGVCLGGGLLLHVTGACPIVKRIWTPAWALFSGGICVWVLLVLFTVLDVIRFRFWAWPLVVVGVNSIAAYSMYQMMRGVTASALQKHLGGEIFRLKPRIGGYDWPSAWEFAAETQKVVDVFEPTIRACMVGLIFWVILLYMHRKRIYIRI